MVYSGKMYADFTKAFFTFRSHTVSLYTPKCDLNYTHKESTALPDSFSVNTQTRNGITHTCGYVFPEFYPNRTINVEIMDRNLCVRLSEGWRSLRGFCTKLPLYSDVVICCVEFYPNLTKNV
jgi:hypothetical protein